MRLYDIAQEYIQLLRMVDDGELTVEMVADTLESINAEFDIKARNCMMVVAELDKDLAGLQVHIDRLTALKKSTESSRETLVEYVKNGMLTTGKVNLDLGLFKLSIRAATKQLPAEIDESLIDEKFFLVVPESKRIDRRALLAEVKTHPIAGIELVDSKRSLTIK